MVLFGYIKANKLTSEYILRQDMPRRNEPVKITKDAYNDRSFNISQTTGVKKVVVKDILNINNGNIEIDNIGDKTQEYKLWVEMSNQSVETYINALLEDYKSRTKLIDAIVTNLIEHNINGISIDFRKVDDKNITRFIIELTPKLREIGISTCIVLNDEMNEQDYMNIVDYIVE